MSARRASVAVVGVALLVAACWSTRSNPLFCNTTADCRDPLRSLCAIAAHECVATGDLGDDLSGPDLLPMCSASNPCQVAGKPICGSDGTCRACQAGDCAAPRGLCATTGPVAGACVECVDESGCAAAQQICDGATGTCVPCSKHTDCTSGVCDDTGRCVLGTNIAYVDNSKAGCASGDGSSTNPLCDVNPAIATGRAYVHVAGSAMTYAAISVTQSTSVSVTIVGPGKVASTKARVLDSNAVAANIAPSAPATTSVVLDGLELIGGNGASYQGVRCVGGGGATAKVTVRDSYIHTSGGLGIDSNGCDLGVERSYITDNKGGITVTGGTYAIENNLIYLNLAAASPAVSLDNTSTGTFRFNTVASNTAGAGRGGVECGAAAAKTISDSIIVGNTAVTGTQVGTQCSLVRVATGGSDGVTGDFAAPPTFVDALSDFHLQAIVANQQCCIDKAMTPTPALSLDVDATRRPKGGGYDIGAHEVQ